MEVTSDRLLEWLEEKTFEGVVIELSRTTIVIRDFRRLKPTKTFSGSTLLLAIKTAWESEHATSTPATVDINEGRCKSVNPDGIRCGLPRNHKPHPHSVLIPTSAPWFPMIKCQGDW